MRMKKVLAATLTAAMVFSLTACGSSGESAGGSSSGSKDASSSSSKSDDLISIGFAQVGHESDWRTASTESCRSTFSKENGYDLSFVETGWDTVLKEAKDAGIPVLVIDRNIKADESLYTAWVGSDFTAEGESAGAWLKAYLEAKKKTDKVNIVTIAGTNGSSAQIGRTKGFNKYVKANGWNLLDEQDGDFTQDGGQKIMESYLKSYKDIDVVVCQNDNEAFGAIDALKAAGKTYGKDGDIIIISFDATNAGLKDVKEGSINADFECNPLAAPYVEDIIKKIKDGGKPDSQKVYVDEACFACDDTVSSFKTDEGKDITMTVVDDKVLKERAY